MEANTEETVDFIKEAHRQHQDLIKAETALTNRIKAKCRRVCAVHLGYAIPGHRMTAKELKSVRSDAVDLFKSMKNGKKHELTVGTLIECAPFLAAHELIHNDQSRLRREMETRAKTLPVHEWVEDIRGFTAFGLAQVVGEAGDLSNYPDKGRLFKRLGIGSINGEAQRKFKDEKKAILHGYNPNRRAVIWVLADSLFKLNEYYRGIANKRKEFEVDKALDEGLAVLPAAKIPDKDKKSYRSVGHIHKRGVRYMSQKFIRDLWREWRRLT